MRRILCLAAVAVSVAAPLFAATPATACAPPAEGEPRPCCEAPYLYYVDVAGQRVGVPDPTWKPWVCD